MIDRMRPIPIQTLLSAALSEHAVSGEIFGVFPHFRGDPRKAKPLFGAMVEVPLGPAAGVHTRMAQNILAAYVGGARFFELEAAPRALDEYVKAWFSLKLLSRELGLGGENGFLFHLSVWYGLEGVRAPETDRFLEGLRNASSLPIWAECRAAGRALLPRLHNVDGAYLDGMDSRICASATASVLRGCPAEEAGAVAAYLREEKGFLTPAEPEDPFRPGAEAWPVTLSATLLKPGGYLRLAQLAKTLPTVDAAAALAARETGNESPRKLGRPLPLLDCFTAPCKGGCPISADIPAYIRLLGEGRRAEALRVILDRNPLPHITGSICAHPCTSGCTRNYYDESVRIRDVERCATEAGWDVVLPEVRPLGSRSDLRVAVAGGGPAGMAAAFFLGRMGARVTLYELRGALGGVVRHLIPDFRVSGGAIDADAQLLSQVGVEILLNTPAPSPQTLEAQGFTHLLLAVGAWSPGCLPLDGSPAMNALDFLARCKDWGRLHRRPERIVVVGGGNTAMDAARAALRLPDTGSVTLVYRRTRSLMPADKGELALALREGVSLRELLGPLAWRDGLLTCEVLRLGEEDCSGRPSPEPTGETVTIPADLVVSAVGDHVDGDLLACYGVEAEPTHGLPLVHGGSLESVSAPRVYLAGDARRGSATVVDAIADAATAAGAILGASPYTGRPLPPGRRGTAAAKHGVLRPFTSPREEDERCLECHSLCEVCVECCPNRANVSVVVPTRRQSQIVHVDGLCGACGNCEAFCPYDGAPYRDKFTVFGTVSAFQESGNAGFVVLDAPEALVRVRLDGVTTDVVLTDEDCPLPSGVQELIEMILANYPYLTY